MRKVITAITTASLLAIAATALAGGWAVTSFENLPERFEAGATYTLEYTILQHGETPADSGASFVTFRDGKESLRFDANNHRDGTYSVEVTLPHDGAWGWSVTSEGWGTQDLGTLQIAPAAASTALDLAEAAKMILPLATLAAGAYTLVQVNRNRRTPARAETP